ncbi:MAG: hypothetical protein J5960_06800, partial [Desulfovibrio sp.]|nr:hypothetical protein [Desulfovibrio sp.]
MARKGRAKALPPKMLTVYGDIVQETEDAILLNVEGEEHWLPKSQIEYIGERGDTDVEVSIPDWLADERALSDGDGKRQETGAAPAEEPAAVQPDEDDMPPEIVDMTLTVVEFFDEGELALVENQDGDEFELKTSDFTHDADEINAGDTLLLHINRDAAVAAGLVD